MSDDRHTPMPLDVAKTILAREGATRTANKLIGCKHVPTASNEDLAEAHMVVRKGEEQSAPGFIYIIRRRRSVKIGYSINPDTRIKALEKQGGERVEVLAIIPGSYEDESSLHRRFKTLRTIGEWFVVDADLRKFIRAAQAQWKRSR